MTKEYEDILSYLIPNEVVDLKGVRICLMNSRENALKYLKNLFKKKRQCATHVLVTMLSDESRCTKPYALPVRYIPYHSIKDQYVRDINSNLKEEMVNAGLTLSVDQNGLEPLVARSNEDIPSSVIADLNNLLHVHGMNFGDALRNMRSRMVPAGFTPFPFRPNVPESELDMTRSIVSTCVFKSSISYWKERGVDFCMYLYVPEIDPITMAIRYDRGDHNHIFRRAAKSIRQGNHPNLDFDAFDAALLDPESGLTHAALVGLRKQSNVDAERLLSFLVVQSLRNHDFHTEAEFVEVLANWHEASDGRGLSQLQRCRYNYNMLNTILDKWMPWHREQYDFSTIDINRPVENLCGFSRETVIEITCNIESQEHRRRLNHVIGYPEHPRAGGTDDLETFFSMVHRYLGVVFTLRDFKNLWPKVVREFKKRMDSELPFYHWTLNERFTTEQPSFDERPNFDEDSVESCKHPLRLHRLKVNQREDSSIIVAGRAFLPVRNQTTIRHRMHCPVADPPPPPGSVD